LRYGAPYAKEWKAARAKLDASYAKSDVLLAGLFDSSKRCEWCSAWFLPERSTKRFCCDEHRVYANRDAVYEEPGRPVFLTEWAAPEPIFMNSCPLPGSGRGTVTLRTSRVVKRPENTQKRPSLWLSRPE
jgi:hypothetical protein